MAHIWYATQGKAFVENVHHFQCELWGIKFCFSHNGEVLKFSGKPFHECPVVRHHTSQDEQHLRSQDYGVNSSTWKCTAISDNLQYCQVRVAIA